MGAAQAGADASFVQAEVYSAFDVLGRNSYTLQAVKRLTGVHYGA